MSSDADQQTSTEDLLRSAAQKMASARREYAEFLDNIAEILNRNSATELGYRTPEKLVADLIRVSPTEARKIVRRATMLHDTVDATGAVSAPDLPATAKAATEGALSVAHLDKIADFIADLPADVNTDAKRIAEETLAEIAYTVPPAGLNRPIAELRARLVPEDSQRDDAELANPHRELHTTWRGNRFLFGGELDREAGMLLEAALSPLSAPRDAEDQRSTPQRYGDAFADLIELGARAKDLPREGGSPVTLFVTMDERDLRDRIAAANTLDGHTVPVEQVRRMACDAGVIPTLLGGRGEVLDTGSRARTAPTPVRNRLILRDRGCAFPGCHQPPAHTQAHHIHHWADGGLSTVDNMVLLCFHHHRTVHHTPWRVHTRPDGNPEFIPPSYLDPTPRLHPDLRLRQPEAVA